MNQLDADDLYIEQVLEARKQPLEQKLWAGIELFDLACEFTKTGIRMQYPNADKTKILEILRARLELGRRLENGT